MGSIGATPFLAKPTAAEFKKMEIEANKFMTRRAAARGLEVGESILGIPGSVLAIAILASGDSMHNPNLTRDEKDKILMSHAQTGYKIAGFVTKYTIGLPFALACIGKSTFTEHSNFYPYQHRAVSKFLRSLQPSLMNYDNDKKNTNENVQDFTRRVSYIKKNYTPSWFSSSTASENLMAKLNDPSLSNSAHEIAEYLDPSPGEEFPTNYGRKLNEVIMRAFITNVQPSYELNS